MALKNREVPKDRWLAAHEAEQRDLKNAELVIRNLALRRYTWSRIVDLLTDEMALDRANRILDIGGGPTTIFLALRRGEKWAVDPNHDVMFDVHPFMRQVEEYEDVNFVSSRIEDVVLDPRFDLAFAINFLDHVGDLKPVINKIDDLLASPSTLVLVVDCYADAVVRNLVSWFDVDVPHPHHFVVNDILSLFSHYRLIKRDDKIHEVFSESPFPQESSVRPHGIRYLVGSYCRHVREEKGGPSFAAKFFLCYSLALLVARLRKRERPIYPLKKPRLFVFHKQ